MKSQTKAQRRKKTVIKNNNRTQTTKKPKKRIKPLILLILIFSKISKSSDQLYQSKTSSANILWGASLESSQAIMINNLGNLYGYKIGPSNSISTIKKIHKYDLSTLSSGTAGTTVIKKTFENDQYLFLTGSNGFIMLKKDFGSSPALMTIEVQKRVTNCPQTVDIEKIIFVRDFALILCDGKLYIFLTASLSFLTGSYTGPRGRVDGVASDGDFLYFFSDAGTFDKVKLSSTYVPETIIQKIYPREDFTLTEIIDFQVKKYSATGIFCIATFINRSISTTRGIFFFDCNDISLRVTYLGPNEILSANVALGTSNNHYLHLIAKHNGVKIPKFLFIPITAYNPLTIDTESAKSLPLPIASTSLDRNYYRAIKIEDYHPNTPYIGVFGYEGQYHFDISKYKQEGGVVKVFSSKFGPKGVYVVPDSTITVLSNEISACWVNENGLNKCRLIYPEKVYDVLRTDPNTLLVMSDDLSLFSRTYLDSSYTKQNEVVYPVTNLGCWKHLTTYPDPSKLVFRDVKFLYSGNGGAFGIFNYDNNFKFLRISSTSCETFYKDLFDPDQIKLTNLVNFNGQTQRMFALYGGSNNIHIVEDTITSSTGRRKSHGITNPNFEEIEIVERDGNRHLSIAYRLTTGKYKLRFVKVFQNPDGYTINFLSDSPEYNKRIIGLNIYETTNSPGVWMSTENTIYKILQKNPYEAIQTMPTTKVKFIYPLRVSLDKNTTQPRNNFFVTKTIGLLSYVTCDSSCSTCRAGGPTNCVACTLPNYFLHPTTNLCTICHSSCATCRGENDNECLSCTSPKYFYETGNRCITCHSSCSSCTGTGENECISCKDDFVKDENSCVSECPIGKYEIDEVCESCNSNCQTCKTTAINCLSCDTAAGMVLSGTVCVSSNCNLGEYFDTGSVSCKSCDSGCLTCATTATSCSSCHPSKFLALDKTCQDQCPDGSYNRILTNICLACNEICKTCITESDKCTSCKNRKFLHGNSCLNPCPDKTTLNPLDFICKSCISPCENCVTTIEKCTSCLEGFYYVDSSNSCPSCDSNCKSCEGNSVSCTACNSPKKLENSKCVDSCSIGFFEKNPGICTQCDSSCLACETSETICTDCRDGKVLVSSKCENCDPTCATCDGVSSKSCLSCPDGVAYHPGTKECNICHNSCLLCSPDPAIGCYGCPEGKLLLKSKNSCIDTCPDDTYIKPIDNKDGEYSCIKCDTSCRTCNAAGPANCLSCQQGSSFNDKGLCEQTCPSAHYLSNKKCLPCFTTCSSCIDNLPENCFSCISGHQLKKSSISSKNGKCAKTCILSKYSDNDGQCQDCHELCSSCFGPTNKECYKCTEEGEFTPASTFCRRKCSEGKYSDDDTCLNCHNSCKTCKGPGENNCLNCRVNYIKSGNGECFCPTGEGYFEKNLECKKCHFKCETCSGESETECLSCSKGFIENKIPGNRKILCQQVCPEKFYKDKGKNSCQPCSSKCRICFGGESSSCKVCSEGFYLLGTECLENCQAVDRHTLSIDKVNCIRCKDPNCKACRKYQPEKCLKCLEPLYLKNEESCVKKCSEGFTEINQNEIKRCVSCPSNCQSCVVSNLSETVKIQCLQCYPSFALHDSQCVERCPKGYQENKFSISGVKRCEKLKCQPECEICRNEIYCEKCKENSKGKLVVNIGFGECSLCEESSGLKEVKNNKGEIKCTEICGDGIFYGMSYIIPKSEREKEIVEIDQRNWLEIQNSEQHECDDGNDESGDGCSSDCRLERGYTCTRVGLLNSLKFKSLRKIPDKCGEGTVAKLERDEDKKEVIGLYLSFSKKITNFGEKKFEKHFYLNFESMKKISENNFEPELEIKKLQNKIQKIGEEYFIQIKDENFNRNLDGEIIIKKNTDSVSTNYQILDQNNLPVILEGTKTRFILNIENYLSKKNSEIRMKKISLISDTTSYQTAIFLSSFNSLFSDLQINVLQKFVYFRLLKLKYPENVNKIFKMFGTLWSTKPGATDYDPEAKRSKIDEILDLKKGDQSPPKEFKKLRYTDISVKTCLPIFLMILLTYVLALCCNILKKIRMEENLKLLEKIVNEREEEEEEEDETEIENLTNKAKLYYWIDEFIDFFRTKIVWNGLIRSNLVAYQNFTIGLFLNLRSFKGEKPVMRISLIFCFISLFLMGCNIYVYFSVIGKGYQDFSSEGEEEGKVEDVQMDTNRRGQVVDNRDGTLTIRRIEQNSDDEEELNLDLEQNKHTDTFPIELKIFNGTEGKNFLKRYFKILRYVFKPMVTSFTICIFYDFPYIPMITILVLNIIEIIAGMLKIYKKGVFNIGLILEGILFSILSILTLILKNRENEGDRDNEKEYNERNSFLGWVFIFLMGFLVAVNILLKFFGRKGL